MLLLTRDLWTLCGGLSGRCRSGWMWVDVSLTTRKTTVQRGTLERSTSLRNVRPPCWADRSVWTLPFPGYFMLLTRQRLQIRHPFKFGVHCENGLHHSLTSRPGIGKLRPVWVQPVIEGWFSNFLVSLFKKKIKRKVIFCDLRKVYEMPSSVSINEI